MRNIEKLVSFNEEDVRNCISTMRPPDFLNEMYTLSHFLGFPIKLSQKGGWGYLQDRYHISIVAAEKKYGSISDFSTIPKKEWEVACEFYENKAFESFKTLSMVYVSKLNIPEWVKGFIHVDRTSVISAIGAAVKKSIFFSRLEKYSKEGKLQQPEIDQILEDRIKSFYKRILTLEDFYRQTGCSEPIPNSAITFFNMGFSPETQPKPNEPNTWGSRSLKYYADYLKQMEEHYKRKEKKIDWKKIREDFDSKNRESKD